jgi:hypothetical protein
MEECRDEEWYKFSSLYSNASLPEIVHIIYLVAFYPSQAIND